jgi:hypothetical protein
VACLALVPVPFVLARLLRRRRLTPLLLVGAMAVFWAAVLGLGMDRVLQVLFPSWNRGPFNLGSPIYVSISALVVALAWMSLRRWLPRRVRKARSEQPTLGSVRGSLLWVMMFVPAVLSSAGTAVLAAPPKPVEVTAGDVCRDQGELQAFQQPIREAELAIHRAATRHAPSATFLAAFRRRIRARAGAAKALEEYESHGSWGAAMQKRLIAALALGVRADRALLQRRIASKAWVAAQRPLELAYDDLAKPVCLHLGP